MQAKLRDASLDRVSRTSRDSPAPTKPANSAHSVTPPGNLRFEWNEEKNASNRQKHRVSFEEAQTVFYDDRALLIADPDHSEAEDRFILLGVSSAARILVVVHSYRDSDSMIRIISARKATKKEVRFYEEGI